MDHAKLAQVARENVSLVRRELHAILLANIMWFVKRHTEFLFAMILRRG